MLTWQLVYDFVLVLSVTCLVETLKSDTQFKKREKRK